MKLLNNKMIAILVAIIAIVLSSLYGLSKRPQEQGAVATDIPPSAMVDDSSALPESQTIDKAYELGKSYYEAEEYAKAITQLGKVETSSDFYEDAQMLILKASDSYRTKIMNLADGYIGEGEYCESHLRGSSGNVAG